MSTDRELDTLLAEASGVRDAELPELPAEFLAALRTGADEPASVLAARQLADDARRARGRRRPSRKVLVRAGAGVLAVAAAWTTAVVVDTQGAERSPEAIPAPPSAEPTELPIDPAGGLTLLAAGAVTFPYSVDPEPEGLTPYLTRVGGLESFGTVDPVAYRALYRSAEDLGFSFSIASRDPRIPRPGVFEASPYTAEEIDERGATSVGGRPADFVRATFDEPDCRYAPSTPTQEEEPEEVCSTAYAELFWQRDDGQWVAMYGQGDRYGDETALVEVAEAIVDRPQPVQLQFELSPENWEVSGYESLSNLSLVDRADPTSLTERISVSLQERWRGERDPEDAARGMADGNPIEQVTVHGRPAALVSVPDHCADPAEGRRMWNLWAQFADGPQFLLQAPDTLTREDVLAMAEGLSYTP
ncbi:hypothetical protein SAMN05660662_0615 [Blastococcus aurantiacus]|uniref:Uncharacterized protein n=1 Tax=Blastococcus aurantiacus TaxID=1550231 RepID=A0A1G7HHL3_9ACTN|nr:hypothetical protein [Blastococcus aurantiacus]SDE99816.1 hypothetical protein SAMN05660662_0615 [Blastococcus aurantiacus]